MMAKKSLFMMLVCFVVSFNSNAQVSKHKRIQKIIDKATHDVLPGVAVYLKTPKQGEQLFFSGYADIESITPLKPNHIFALGSIGKTYCAVAVLKLVEQEKLKLDDKICKYLPDKLTSFLPNSEQVTIRHLLANTSGFYNYDKDPELNNLYLNGELDLDTLSHFEALKRFVKGKEALCLPGKAYHYSSTNYMLLAMIMDKVTPNGHAHFIREELLKREGLNHSFYKQTPPSNLVHHYGDLNQDGVLEDLTAQTIETTNWFSGDDGIYASLEDAAHFMEMLLTNQLLSDSSMIEMKTWNDEKSPDYGLGLMADKGFPYKFLMGHSGRGIGTTTDVYYFPKQQITLAILCNTGIRAASPVFKKQYFKMRKQIVKKLFLF